MLRAGPFSDERIIGLANRRFVPFYFDLNPNGAAGDADARKFVVAARKELGGEGVPTPPVLLMDADGKVLGECDNYAKADKVLAVMQKVLKEHPEFAKESGAESKLAGVERAQLLADLQELDGAAKALDGVAGAKAAYLRGRIARMRKDWDAMESALNAVDDKDLADDARMERAYKFWHAKEFEGLRDHLKDFPKESNRHTEARYLEGLALYKLDEKDAALEVWSSMIKACAQDPWIYRADWAYCNVKDGSGSMFSSDAKGSSLLGRIGYMGGRNPDLKGP